MKTALAGILDLQPGVVAEMYSVALSNGTTFRYTTADLNLPFLGATYYAGRFNLERSPISTTVGVAVDDVTLTIYPQDWDVIAGLSFQAFAIRGGFDNAVVKIYRARRDYAVHLFEGLITATPQIDKVKIQLVVSAPTQLLNVEMPRNAYTSGCIRRLYDVGCGVSKSFYGVNYSVNSATISTISVSSTKATGYFDMGTLEFTSGANAGLARTIKKFTTGGVFTLANSFPSTPQAGDSFTAYPGCDKLKTTCNNFFNNLGRYKGFPYIPTPETSI